MLLIIILEKSHASTTAHGMEKDLENDDKSTSRLMENCDIDLESGSKSTTRLKVSYLGFNGWIGLYPCLMHTPGK